MLLAAGLSRDVHFADRTLKSLALLQFRVFGV